MIFTTPNVSQAIGTSNQVLVNGGTSAVSGAVTFTLPQNIDTAATVTFGTVKSSQSNEPIFYLYSSNGTATNRNWAVASSDQNFGDFVISQSNALGGDPIAAGTRRIYITQAGVTILGVGSTYTTYGSQTQLLEINQTSGRAGTALNQWTASSAGGTLEFNKSRGATVGTNTIVVNGDELGNITFNGADGTNFDSGAAIYAYVDGTPGAGTDMPGRLVFYTSPDGTATLTQRMTILNSGVVTIGGTTNTAYGRLGQFLEVNGPVGSNYGGISMTGWTASDNPILLDLNKSKSGTIGTHTIVANGDFIAAIVARGSNGTGFDDAASIRFYIDAAPGATADMPGRVSIWTTPDGSATSVERMRFDSAGTVSISQSNNVAYLDIYGPDNASPVVDVRINATQANITAADTFMFFKSTGGAEGGIAGTAVAGVIAYNTFTGSHWSQSDEDRKKEIILTSQTTGKEKDSYATTIEPGTVLCSIDEMCYWKEEGYSQTLPKYKISDKKEDKSVYGVHGGVDDDGDTIILALGTGIVLVTDEGGEIEIGDMLCTSSIPGYAMKYTGTDLSVVGFKARQAHKSGQGKIACTIQAG